ncbi:MAG: Ig domain-containing protein [Terrimicrobiaceae bacterium]|nr:Ig domain-containing protein [Terrimicrobiaceae bacterium]
MKKRFSGFSDQTYPSFSPNVEASRLINLYPEIVETGHGENPERLVLLGTPGRKVFARLAEGPIRAQHTETYQFPAVDRTFAVSGAKFYEIFDDGTSIERGSVSSDGFPAYIASNGTQLVITSLQLGYLFDLATNDFSGPILDDNGDEITPINVVSLANRFVATFVSVDFRQRIFYSDLDDGNSWPALNFFSADLMPDNVVALLADHEQLWAFGDQSVQPFASTTENPDNPYAAIPGALIETGCAAPASPTKADNTIFWIGGDERGRAIAWRAAGYAGKRISTHAIEQLMRKMPAIYDCRGYAYVENGHTFVVFTFPLGRNTLVYDASNGKWHERGCWAGTEFDADHAWSHAFAFGKHLVGDRGGDCCVDSEGDGVGPGSGGTLVITTTCPIDDGEVDTAYDVTFEAAGGLPPYTWALISGAFPEGLTFGSDGTLTGTPTEDGVFSFTVGVTDSSVPPLTDEATCQITVTEETLSATCPETLVEVECFDDSMQGRADSSDIGAAWTQWGGVIDPGGSNYNAFSIFDNVLISERQPPAQATADHQAYPRVAAYTALDPAAPGCSSEMTFDHSEVAVSHSTHAGELSTMAGVALRIQQVGVGTSAIANASFYALSYIETKHDVGGNEWLASEVLLDRNEAGGYLFRLAFTGQIAQFQGGEKLKLTAMNYMPTSGPYAGTTVVCLKGYIDWGLGDGWTEIFDYEDPEAAGAAHGALLTGRAGIAITDLTITGDYGYTMFWYDWHGCELGV